MSDRDDDLARWRRAFAAPAGAPERAQECPQPELIWSAARGELPKDRIRALVDHTATCAACAEDWRLAAALAGDSEAPAAEAHADPSPIRRWLAPARDRPVPARGPWAAAPALPAYRSWIAAAAAAAVLLVGLGIEIGRLREKPVYRGSEAVKLRIANGVRLPRGACKLVWTGPDDAIYSVEVHTMAGEPIAVAPSLPATGDETSYVVPAGKLSPVKSGTRLEWQVTAHLPKKTLQSPVGNFILE